MAIRMRGFPNVAFSSVPSHTARFPPVGRPTESESPRPPPALAIGRPVEVVEICVRKQKKSKIGINLLSNTKDTQPYVNSTDDTQEMSLQEGDILAELNGRPCWGATNTAKRLISARQTRLTIWRPVR